jgi:GMP synthase (glutamine-hydrolysing)
MEALQGVINPEDKRKIIGNLFIDIISQYSDDILSSDTWIVCQGTIYPDTIESKGTKNADLIKTHHNRVPKMQVLISQGKVMEPFSHLYKDEVRILGKMLGLSDNIVNRHPFPGPGLGVRILCNDKDANFSELKLLQQDVSFINIKAQVLPIKSVGVQGDKRTYKYPAVIEIKNIRDISVLDWDSLEKQSTELTNKVAGINRVVLLIAKKDGEYALKKVSIIPERVELLQKADNIVNNIILREKLYDSIWQMPIVLVPLSINGGESIILRPVDSQEAMTARFSRIPIKIVLEICNLLMTIDGIDAVFYDITNKPPGTIEWE